MVQIYFNFMENVGVIPSGYPFVGSQMFFLNE